MKNNYQKQAEAAAKMGVPPLTRCLLCNGELKELGTLGRIKHLRCINCGADMTEEPG